MKNPCKNRYSKVANFYDIHQIELQIISTFLFGILPISKEGRFEQSRTLTNNRRIAVKREKKYSTILDLFLQNQTIFLLLRLEKRDDPTIRFTSNRFTAYRAVIKKS